MTAEISVTVKGGPEYDAPWVVFKGTVDEVGKSLADFRNRGLFGAVKAATAEFREAPVTTTAQAVKNVQAAIPGSQELPTSVLPKCPACGADGVQKTGHSTKQNRDYSGVFCSKDCGAKPMQFQWVS